MLTELEFGIDRLGIDVHRRTYFRKPSSAPEQGVITLTDEKHLLDPSVEGEIIRVADQRRNVARLPKSKYHELIAGERRFRAVRDFAEMKTIPTQIVKATDLETRSISAAENIQRENLSAIETIEAIVAIVDAELIKDKQYAATGKKPADRMKTLLGKLHSISISKNRGSMVSKEAGLLSKKNPA